MSAKIRICSVCRKEYEYCPKCREYEHLPVWMLAFCSENCKSIFNATSDYEDGKISANEAKQLIDTLDLSRLSNFGTSYQNTIKTINENIKSSKEIIHVDEKPNIGEMVGNKNLKSKNKKIKTDIE